MQPFPPSHRPMVDQVDYRTLAELEMKCRQSGHLNCVSGDKEYYMFVPKLAAFLIARDKKLNDAFEMWKEWVAWRESARPHFVTWDQVRQEFYKGKVRFTGRDRKGNLVLYFKGKRHFPEESTVEELFKMIFYLLELGEMRWRNGDATKITFVYDREDMTMANVDTNFMSEAKGVVGKMQNYYPERVAHILILHPNWFFKTMFAIISPFLSSKTTEKIVIISDLMDLHKYVDAACLPPESHGTQTDPFTQVYIPKVEKPKPIEKPGFFGGLFGASSPDPQIELNRVQMINQANPYPRDDQLPPEIRNIFHYVDRFDLMAQQGVQHPF
jgi:hypothetical protein